MISDKLSAELSATCNALGYATGTTYHADPYVKETITDLIRYLRRDEEDHSIRRHLGKAKILQTDLIPILIHHSDKEELFDVLLRLLVNLTNPALLIYQEELPGDRTSRHYYMEIVSHLQSYKEAFTQSGVWEVLTAKLEKLLNVPYQDRDEDQSRTMERILILARNVLQVPADSEGERRPDNDASVHDQVLWCLHQAGMVDLFLYIASTDREQQYYMHILEIVSLMLREQNPSTLASAALQRSVEEKERDEKELLEIRRRETLEKQSKTKKYAGSRHSRFGGTFVMKDVKSISDKDLIYHKPLNKAVTLSLDFEKQRARVPKNKLALTYQPSERRSAFSVRLFLKEFCVEFLNGAYNPLMYKVRENLVRAVSQPNDETYYFWAMKFFMEFNRHYKFQVKFVSETMHQQIFHFVQTQMENWLEMMITDKKHIPIWSRRVHQALKAYQELLFTLQKMDMSPDESVRRSATVIKSNVFYQSEYRELLLFLFNVFTEMKFSKVYLKDLVETTHIFMRMLEGFCKNHQTLVVQDKPKRRAVKKKKPAKSKSGQAGQVNLESLWDQVGPELSAVLQGSTEIPTDVVPFDATSGLSMEEEKVEAMKKIKAEMMQSNFEQAVALLRASREVWPENDCFGRSDMPPEEEFLAMREIFMADIGQLAEVAVPQEENEDEEKDDDDDDEEEGDERDIVIPESVFKFSEFVGRFASPKVLAPVCLLLESFEQNSIFTNKCIVKLLHRVAVDCKMPQMLFQATLFRTFQRAFKSTNPYDKEVARLGKFIVREFARMATNNKKIYMELLFWKNNKEAYELEYGYGSSETKSHSAKNVWGEEHEDELRRLAQEYEENTPEPDAVGWIMKNMINQSRSRRAVIKKLKELYLVVGNMKPKKSKNMDEEEISQLKSLFEEFKDSPDPLNCILGRLSVARGRNFIANKLLELGLISDKKELRKKRPKKNKIPAKEREWGYRSDDESIYDSWSDDNGGPSTSSLQKKKTTEDQQRPQNDNSDECHRIIQMIAYLEKVINADLREALEWFMTELQDVLGEFPKAEENEEGSALLLYNPECVQEEGTALLPVNPECVQAMDNPTFQQLLDLFSIQKPTDQERYWRIPGTWGVKDLTLRINMIKRALHGTLPDIFTCPPSMIKQLKQNLAENEVEAQHHVSEINLPTTSTSWAPSSQEFSESVNQANAKNDEEVAVVTTSYKNKDETFGQLTGEQVVNETESQISLSSNTGGKKSRLQGKIRSGDDSNSNDDCVDFISEVSSSRQGNKMKKRKSKEQCDNRRVKKQRLRLDSDSDESDERQSNGPLHNTNSNSLRKTFEKSHDLINDNQIMIESDSDEPIQNEIAVPFERTDSIPKTTKNKFFTHKKGRLRIESDDESDRANAASNNLPLQERIYTLSSSQETINIYSSSQESEKPISSSIDDNDHAVVSSQDNENSSHESDDDSSQKTVVNLNLYYKKNPTNIDVSHIFSSSQGSEKPISIHSSPEGNDHAVVTSKDDDKSSHESNVFESSPKSSVHLNLSHKNPVIAALSPRKYLSKVAPSVESDTNNLPSQESIPNAASSQEIIYIFSSSQESEKPISTHSSPEDNDHAVVTSKDDDKSPHESNVVESSPKSTVHLNLSHKNPLIVASSQETISIHSSPQKSEESISVQTSSQGSYYADDECSSEEKSDTIENPDDSFVESNRHWVALDDMFLKGKKPVVSSNSKTQIDNPLKTVEKSSGKKRKIECLEVTTKTEGTKLSETDGYKTFPGELNSGESSRNKDMDPSKVLDSNQVKKQRNTRVTEEENDKKI